MQTGEQLEPDYEAELALQYMDGESVAEKLKRYVNCLIDAGEYAEGYELAVCGGELDRDQVGELMDMIMTRNPRGRDWFVKVRNLIAEFNPDQWPISYVFVDRDNLIVANGFRLMRVTGDGCRWVTKEITWDGFMDIRVADGKVTGLWSMGYLEPWVPFVVDYEDGRLEEG